MSCFCRSISDLVWRKFGNQNGIRFFFAKRDFRRVNERLEILLYSSSVFCKPIVIVFFYVWKAESIHFQCLVILVQKHTKEVKPNGFSPYTKQVNRFHYYRYLKNFDFFSSYTNRIKPIFSKKLK